MIWDRTTEVHRQFGSKNIPDTFFVDEHGRLVQAFAERALAIFEAKLGPEHLQSAFARMQSAYVLVKLGRAEEALAAATRARTALTVALGADHPHVASAASIEADARTSLSQR